MFDSRTKARRSALRNVSLLAGFLVLILLPAPLSTYSDGTGARQEQASKPVTPSLPLCDPFNTCQTRCSSPIIVDTSGNGFDLTDAAGGVNFDIRANGTAVRVSWTAAGSDDAFLCYDRNGNGRVDDGAELFGDRTPQPESSGRNGFAALAMFDGAALGGNSDAVIDDQDTVCALLRLWIDANHNGFSEQSELHTLSSLGLEAISLEYKTANRQDRHGNLFRYRAKVYGEHRAHLGRWAWDVFLLISQ